jgi:hypothetical protein
LIGFVCADAPPAPIAAETMAVANRMVSNFFNLTSSLVRRADPSDVG